MAGSNLPNFNLLQRKAFACTFTSRHEVKKCLDVGTPPLEKKKIFQCKKAYETYHDQKSIDTRHSLRLKFCPKSVRLKFCRLPRTRILLWWERTAHTVCTNYRKLLQYGTAKCHRYKFYRHKCCSTYGDTDYPKRTVVSRIGFQPTSNIFVLNESTLYNCEQGSVVSTDLEKEKYYWNNVSLPKLVKGTGDETMSSFKRLVASFSEEHQHALSLGFGMF